MTRVVYATATSLDGYLADPGNSLDWLFAVDGGPEAIAELEFFLAGVSLQVMGSTTYRWLVEHEELVERPEKWRDLYQDRKTIVFSTRADLPRVRGADVEFRSGPVAEHLGAILGAADGGDVHLVGGGGLAVQFAQVGRLDAIHLSIAPVTLGEGAPLFPSRFESSRLRLRTTHQVGQFIQAEYDLLPR